MHRWIMIFLVAVATIGGAAAQDMSSFHAAAERMATALKGGDIEVIAQSYAEDARILPPGREIIQGREAIKAFWAADIKGMSDFNIATLDVKPLGENDVRELGQFSGRTIGDNPQEFTGKYITIWHKSGDNWQISDDIWNLNK